MQKVLHRHGLNHSCRIFRLGNPLLCLHAPYDARRFNGDKSTANREAAGQRKKGPEAQNIILENSKFLGLPYLDKDKLDDHGDRESPPSSHRAPLLPRVKAAEHDQDPSAKTLNRQSIPAASNGLSTEGIARPNEHEHKRLPRRRLLRRIRMPKRSPRLIWERKRMIRVGEMVDPTTGEPRKSLSREALDTEVLEAELRWVSRNSPHPKAMHNLLQILVEQRKIKPSPEYYEALILGNCFPELGSVDNVKIILQEMERESIPLEPHILFAVIMVLAVHPDTDLRTNIMDRLAQQQANIPDLCSQLVMLAMIREGQMELATMELEKLTQKLVPIPRWLWTIYIHAICDQHDFDALIQLLYKLSDVGFYFPQPTLLHLLIIASEQGDLAVTKWVWHGYVESMHIIPDEALCMSVLRVAAANKDLKLARSVRVVLESVAGDIATTPPSLKHQRPGPNAAMFSMSFNSPDFPGLPALAGLEDHKPSESLSEPDSSPPAPSSVDEEDLRLAWAMSTPPVIPDTSQPGPFRPLPAEAITLLSELGIDTDSDIDVSLAMAVGQDNKGEKSKKLGPRRPVTPGNLYKVFRVEEGMRSARFDPRLALMQGWDWRKK